MTQEPEYYKPQPLPPRDGARAGGHQPNGGYRQGGFQQNPGASQWGQPRQGPAVVNVVGGKSALLSYVLWFFLGWLGVHKFYLQQPFQGIFYVLLWVIGWFTTPIIIGWFILGLWGLLMIIDLFLIPLRVAQLNARLARRVNGY
ncbi:TM2 domain-containing protein [Kocuria carniphila]|uniref:TM2 domain-containing protein n=1 Tax=Kocuria carniphila TaxID=262208 RepID=UPI0021A38B99|nr:TM2 domain-containing protein [Kocuria carniphila]MCT1801835.1 TM2 domain-containing protein [Kocuria carniphila]